LQSKNEVINFVKKLEEEINQAKDSSFKVEKNELALSNKEKIVGAAIFLLILTILII